MRDDLRSDKNAPSSAAPALHALLVVVVAVQKWPLCVRALSLLPPFAYQADPILLIEGSKFASINCIYYLVPPSSRQLSWMILDAPKRNTTFEG